MYSIIFNYFWQLQKGLLQYVLVISGVILNGLTWITSQMLGASSKVNIIMIKWGNHTEIMKPVKLTLTTWGPVSDERKALMKYFCWHKNSYLLAKLSAYNIIIYYHLSGRFLSKPKNGMTGQENVPQNNCELKKYIKSKVAKLFVYRVEKKLPPSIKVPSSQYIFELKYSEICSVYLFSQCFMQLFVMSLLYLNYFVFFVFVFFIFS